MAKDAKGVGRTKKEKSYDVIGSSIMILARAKNKKIVTDANW